MGNKDKKKKKLNEDNSKELHLNIDSSNVKDNVPTLKKKNNNRFVFDLDSESEESVKEKKPVKTQNSFNFCDSEDSEEENVINKKPIKQQNPFDFEEFYDSDSINSEEVNENDKELETVLKISADPIPIKEDNGTIICQNNVKEKIIDNSNNKNKENKENKINKKENKRINKLEKNKDRNNLNLRTYYSDNIEIDINGKKIIYESNIVINSNTKYFVMGYNGCGKTTLLKYIFNKLKDNLDILMIDQDIEIESNEERVCDFILNADPELYKKYQEIVILENKEELNDDETEKYQELSEYVYQKGWDRYEAESKKILNGLGFINPNIKVSILSGGWRMRLALGKALLRRPEILILDEPTNHLDLNAVIWLTGYLTGYDKTLIVITHQIGLVNSIADIVWYIGNLELKGNKVFTIRGNYNRLLQFMDNLDKEMNSNYNKFQKKITELKKKSTPKKDVEVYIKKNNVPRPPKPYIVNIDWENIIKLSTKNIIDFRDVYFNYGEKKIYEKLNIALDMGSRIVLVGENGVGKTTFFKLASDELKPNDGDIYFDHRLRVGYYNQQIIDTLPLHLTPIEYLQEIDSSLDQNKCRGILGKLGIKKTELVDLPKNIIENLSGGQKARVSLASIQMKNPHLILFDEPTNHLDIESIDGLINGINNFNGGVVVITHDMYLIESIENSRIYEVKNNNLIKFNGEFDEYCDMVLDT
jgi:ATP-binding cassette, subfamily F, member 1